VRPNKKVRRISDNEAKAYPDIENEYVFDNKGKRYLVYRHDEEYFDAYYGGYKLTDKEKDVLQCRLEGFSFKEIGLKCQISPQRAHRLFKKIKQKLQEEL